jgi:hypothetical protein
MQGTEEKFLQLLVARLKYKDLSVKGKIILELLLQT